MRPAHRIMTALLALAMLVAMPMSAFANDDARVVDTVTEQDFEVDHPVRDLPVVDVVETDRPSDRPEVDDERDKDGEVRHRCLLTDSPRRCLHHPNDRPHDLNVRQLIWRLIQAHEWQTLFRLLHWLGVI